MGEFLSSPQRLLCELRINFNVALVVRRNVSIFLFNFM